MQEKFSLVLRQIALVLCVCLLVNSLASAAGPLDPAAARQKIQDHGVGHVVDITETDGSHVKGRIVSIDADSVQIAPKGLSPAAVPYAQVAAVHGPGLSKGAKIGIAAGIAIVVVVVVVALVFRHNFDKGFKTLQVPQTKH